MRFNSNLSIKVKLLAGFTLVALIAGLIGVTGIMQMRTMDQRDNELYTLNTVPIAIISDISTAYQRMRISIRDIVLFSSSQKRQKKNADYIRELDDTIQKLFVEFEKGLSTKTIRDEFKILKNTFYNYKPARDKLIELGMADEARSHKKASNSRC